jgi:preprotein translocase subunit SecF
MEFIKPGINIDFIGKRKIAFALSITLVVLTAVLLIWRGGPNYGVDFSGGVLIQVKLDQASTPTEIRKAFTTPVLQEAIIQEFGEEGEFEYLIRVRQPDVELSGLNDQVKAALTDRFGQGVEIRRV